MKHSLLLVLLLSLAACVAVDSYAAKPAIPRESFTLSNGLRFLVIPNHKAPVVAHHVWYNVGAQDEAVGKSGLAHFLEHLMFKATLSHPTGEFSKIIAARGGSENAFTTDDLTAYYQVVAKEHLETMMALEADRMQHLQFDGPEIERERAVILEERRMRLGNDPEAQLVEQSRAALFSSHPYHKPTIGWEPDIQTLSLEDLSEFYHRWYAPNNALVTVVGDVEIAQVKELAERYYGAIPKQDLPRKDIVIEPKSSARHSIELRDSKTQTPRVLQLYHAPSYLTATTSDNPYAIQLLIGILGGTNTSRLYERLVHAEGKALAVNASYDPAARGPSYVALSAIPSEGTSTTDLIAQVEHEAKALCTTPPRKEELSHFQSALLAHAIYAEENPTTLALKYGKALTLGRSVKDVDAWPARIRAVTAKQVQAAACRIFSTPPVTGFLLPQAP